MICGKTIYPDQASAVDSIKGFQRDKRVYKSKSQPINSYYCKACEGWHITSKKGTNKKGIERREHLVNTVPVTKLHRGFLVIHNYTSQKI